MPDKKKEVMVFLFVYSYDLESGTCFEESLYRILNAALAAETNSQKRHARGSCSA